MQRGEILAHEGMALDGYEVQALATVRIQPPRRAGCHEIEPQAEAGFDDREYASAGPARRQVVAMDKNVPCLLRPRACAVIDVPELFRERRA
jgi:hypothetical protein